MIKPVLTRILLLFGGRHQDPQTQMMMNTVTEVRPNAGKARRKQDHPPWEVRERRDQVDSNSQGKRNTGKSSETPKIPGSCRDQCDPWQGRVGVGVLG